MLTTPIPINSL